MEYFVPKIAQILSSCNDIKGPSPLKGLGSVIKLQNEYNSKFQFHSSISQCNCQEFMRVRKPNKLYVTGRSVKVKHV